MVILTRGLIRFHHLLHLQALALCLAVIALATSAPAAAPAAAKSPEATVADQFNSGDPELIRRPRWRTSLWTSADRERLKILTARAWREFANVNPWVAQVYGDKP